ncbi:unnamed protein product [Paramecium sonneborni]|uniref:Transmembrane protein n=1 Tax=Paramecium sonneborni TaxID=65129 RepID=A0A8S1LZX6_9CILI|nr:unnamed protein product [Paramecium sonneborni]
MVYQLLKTIIKQVLQLRNQISQTQIVEKMDVSHLCYNKRMQSTKIKILRTSLIQIIFKSKYQTLCAIKILQQMEVVYTQQIKKYQLLQAQFQEIKLNMVVVLYLQENLFILNNSAEFGSGIYNQDKLKSNLNGIQLLNNNYQNYSNQIEEYPQQIYLQMFDNEILIPKVVSSNINQQHAQFISKNGQQTIFRVPTGIKIAEYRKFEIKNNHYNQKSIQMKLFPVNQQLEIVRNLFNTYCELSIKNLNYSTEQVENLINSNKNKFYFNEKTFAYELDDLIFYLPQIPDIIYELSIQCNSIFVPIVNKQNQLIENYHQNYLLTLLIQPLECQLGEFSQDIKDYCHQCRVDQKQYSVTIRATQCQIVDDTKIQNFTQAQIFLKQNYWRMYVTSSIINLCSNKQENCIGGWGVGDNLCKLGYLGALCEQCDYYNIRGGGQFQRIHQFECQICEEFNYSYLMNLAILILLQNQYLQQIWFVVLYNQLSYQQKK